MLSSLALTFTVLTALLSAASNVLVRGGIDRAGGFAPKSLADLPWAFLRLMLTPLFTIGFILYFCSALTWFRCLALAPLSTVYPIMVSLVFVLVTLAAAALFGERLSPRKLLGIATIIGGIFLVSFDPGLFS